VWINLTLTGRVDYPGLLEQPRTVETLESKKCLTERHLKSLLYLNRHSSIPCLFFGKVYDDNKLGINIS